MEFHRARSVEEALSLLVEFGDEARLLAGGTDVMVQYLRGEMAPAALIHIEGIADLDTISSNGRTVVGALATHRTLGAHQLVRRSHPALAAAARTVGGWQTQSVGTVGGNICNASPAADTAPPLLVSDAHVTLASQAGRRRIALTEFFVGRRRTAAAPDEIVIEIDVEPLGESQGEVYLKVGRRGAMEVAQVGLALRLGFDGEAVGSARVAVCSVAPTPRRVPAAEEVLIGSTLEAAALDAAAAALRAAASPIDDARASAAYRTRILRGLLGRAADACREQVAS